VSGLGSGGIPQVNSEYRYFAIVDAEHGVDNPLFVVREWRTELGFDNEEVLTRALDWESTNRLERQRAENADAVVEISEAEAARFSGPPKPPTPRPVPPRKNHFRTARRIAVPIVVLVVAVFGFRAFSASTTNVGDCLEGSIEDPESVGVVDCGPDAKFKVVGKTGELNEERVEQDPSLCENFPTTDAVLWQGKSGIVGTALCLEDLKTPGKRLPTVGDCLKGDITDFTKVDKVECGPGADYRVLGRDVELLAHQQSSPTCGEFPATGAVLSWPKVGAVVPANRVLCLEDVRAR